MRFLPIRKITGETRHYLLVGKHKRNSIRASSQEIPRHYIQTPLRQFPRELVWLSQWHRLVALQRRLCQLFDFPFVPLPVRVYNSATSISSQRQPREMGTAVLPFRHSEEFALGSTKKKKKKKKNNELPSCSWGPRLFKIHKNKHGVEHFTVTHWGQRTLSFSFLVLKTKQPQTIRRLQVQGAGFKKVYLVLSLLFKLERWTFYPLSSPTATLTKS